MAYSSFVPNFDAPSVPISFAANNGILITKLEGDSHYTLVYRRGCNIQAFHEVHRIFGKNFPVKEEDEDAFSKILENFYSQQSENSQLIAGSIESDTMDFSSVANALEEPSDLLSSDDDAPIIKLLNSIFFEAIRKKASDIHIETYENELLIRFRLDGVLQTVLTSKPQVAPLLISRVKVLANLDIAEKRKPQDGRISVKLGGRLIDLRISSLPAAYGERVVLRVLDKESSKLDLDSLGMPEKVRQRLEKVIKSPNGVILVTGPTGSGKTTTLYAVLAKLDRKSFNIMTVEDPIEYYFNGISQTQVNMKANMTFASSLRAILRQDPDIVLIGEIRDKETAQISAQASLTGHLVLSTLHTNTAVGVVTRLYNLGLEPFLISSTLQAVMAQRLVRRLCQNCKQAITANQNELEIMHIPQSEQVTIYKQVGCNECNNSGYRGRVGLYELVVMDTTAKHMISERASEIELAQHCAKENPSLFQAGIERVLEGMTTLSEVLRVTQDS